jgi:hypothetical protein
MSDKDQNKQPDDPQEDDDGYQPLELPAPPSDEAARRRLREKTEARAARKEIVLGQLAVAFDALDAAETAGDEAATSELRQRIETLITERNGL